MDIKRSLLESKGRGMPMKEKKKKREEKEKEKEKPPTQPPSALQLAVSFQPVSLHHTKLMGEIVQLLSSSQLGPEQTASELLRSSSELRFKGSHFRS